MPSLDLPWPSKDLQPNARVNRFVKARAVKKARADATWCAKAAGIGRIEAKKLLVTLTFTPPNRIRRDTDNLLASMKAAIDGIADATGVDDSKWDFVIRTVEPRPLGNVHVQIEVAA